MSTSPILIVDDEPSNLATLKQILGPVYPLAFARNGAECLAAARKHRPILILLDIQMPDMDGYAVCSLLKADPLTESTPVIFVSALGETGAEAAGFDSGGVDYIIKPVSPALVLARVRTHLSLVRATTLERYVKQLEIEQAKTARLSRIHAVLSGTNSAIVRIREPQALMAEACLIVVKLGGFGLAWIGLAEEEGTVLTLAASQGAEPGLLASSLGLEAGVTAAGLGIPAQVLARGKLLFCNDVRTTALEDRSSQDALSRGYLSIVGLPLVVEEKVVGVMVLYARERGFFDEEELKLLNELSGDISFALQAIEYEKRARFLSYYDPLTALPNTSLFLDRLDQLVKTAARANSGAFVMALNLDRFKQLNDAFGRHVGDQVLRLVAKRLEETVSSSYSVARLGADNFALLGEQVGSKEVSILCEKITSALMAPMVVDGVMLHVSARLGVALFPADADTAEALFKNAEVALKQTRSSKTRYLFYSPQLNARMAEKFAMENLLKAAVEKQQFVLHYQPKVDLGTGQIIGAEALIRWQHPERGMVSPAEFIPLAEETGLIGPIGAWVIRTVCAQQAAWLRDFLPVVPIALNLSALQFRESNILEVVREALTEYALDPTWLELELTESLVMQDPEGAEKTLRSFRGLGLSLSLDDFGTGYSSLAYLKRFPFNTVKIDRAFVTDVTRNPGDAAINTAIIGMAHSLRMNVIAEGVETESQLKFLRNRQCDQMQGYYFSRPVLAEDFAAMLRGDKHLEMALELNAEQPTLLIVDNEESTLSALNRALRREGYRILTAQGSLEALELLASHSVQVVLCDQRLSKTTGVDFLTIVAQLYPDTMRIVLSGYTELQSVLDVVNRAEIYRFLTKPWDDGQLRQNIREAFRRYRPSDAVAAQRVWH
ncbi:diguanylate cyclase (GGDEF)-like protein [Rhodoferax ferrireducens]|uniref:Diguanylate cyclase (GGDEF)-like protein n=1 Tax=Rhodoferax ferrireducens TaxID=192843 RepID=A0ABU2C3J7_9BURK|nr:EAL domain-containing protein [Rhodoferax ferrireducens]MDR7375905.1 diguanylate cyclase (GGDEF)-like protein [Rhodoferax ferrireducens]